MTTHLLSLVPNIDDDLSPLPPSRLSRLLLPSQHSCQASLVSPCLYIEPPGIAMATNGYHASVGDMARGLIATVKTLTVSELKNLLRRQGLTVSGVKTELQLRSIASTCSPRRPACALLHTSHLHATIGIEKNLAAGERDQLEMVRQHLRPGGGAPSYPSPYSNNTPTSSASPQFSSPSHKYLPQPSGYAMPRNPNPYTPSGGLRFNDSPFYRIVKPLTSVVELKGRISSRGGVD